MKKRFMKTERFQKRKRIRNVCGSKYELIEYQCPICKKWFNSYYGSWTNAGVKIHIAKIAKSEALSKMLGDIKDAPHVKFYKSNTYKTDIYKREWKFYQFYWLENV